MRQVHDDLTGETVTLVSEWHYTQWHSPGWVVRMPDGTEEKRFSWDITELSNIEMVVPK
jgi:hypothetical protein